VQVLTLATVRCADHGQHSKREERSHACVFDGRRVDREVTDHEVVIAGGGPTGMVLAAELTLAGVDVVVVERRADQGLDGSRAGGLHSRTLEVLDQRGVADRFVAAGTRHPAVGFAMTPLDIGDFPSRHNYVLALWQLDIERLLAGWVEELGVAVRRSTEVVGFTQDDGAVEVQLSDGSLRSQYLIGCDGGRSLVRKAAGIDFPGLPATTSWVIAEVETVEPPEVGMRPEGGGIGSVDPAASGGPYRMVLKEQQVELAEPNLQDLRDALVASLGTDYGVHSPRWISRFSDMTRQAASYRNGRVLLAGDAAHVHPPQGGQGLNVGVQDAVNLGWKLAQVVAGTSTATLLDTYHDERHPVGARVLHNTKAAVALSMVDDRHLALRDIMADLLGMDEPRRHLAGMISGLDVHYDLGEGHPLLGRRMPDLDLLTADGPTTVATLLHEARPLLLALDGMGVAAQVPAPDRVRRIDATYNGPWQLPVLGEVTAPPAVLVRPDGHVAWAGALTDAGLADAMTTWFGGGSS
jgi:2-polyprenyl-6-methoxyphenol hydroxylase-like FAD-dependent oxidoreductase